MRALPSETKKPWWLVAAVVGIAASAIAGGAVAALNMYANTPQAFRVEHLPVPDPPVRNLLFVLPGRGDGPDGWPARLIESVRAGLPDPEQWQCLAYDWRAYADNYLRAAASGLAIGDALGRRLAGGSYPYERIHLVCHSVGAFVAHGLCRTYAENAGQPAAIHLTLLDPFVVRGLFDLEFGQEHFGEGTVFAEAYLNLDDRVLGTNVILEQAHNFDLTESRLKKKFRGEPHRWPIAYYLLTAERPDQKFGYGVFTWACQPRGRGPGVSLMFPPGEVTRVP